MNWDHPEPFIRELVVADDDMDGLAHTNNAVYVSWCEATAWNHSEALGLGLAEYQAMDRAMAVRRACYEYLRATGAGDPLAIATWIVSWDGRLSMTRKFQIINTATGATVLRGDVEFVCIEISTGKPRRLPPRFLEVYAPAILSAG